MNSKRKVDDQFNALKESILIEQELLQWLSVLRNYKTWLTCWNLWRSTWRLHLKYIEEWNPCKSKLKNWKNRVVHKIIFLMAYHQPNHMISGYIPCLLMNAKNFPPNLKKRSNIASLELWRYIQVMLKICKEMFNGYISIFNKRKQCHFLSSRSLRMNMRLLRYRFERKTWFPRKKFKSFLSSQQRRWQSLVTSLEYSMKRWIFSRSVTLRSTSRNNMYSMLENNKSMHNTRHVSTIWKIKEDNCILL